MPGGLWTFRITKNYGSWRIDTQLYLNPPLTISDYIYFHITFTRMYWAKSTSEINEVFILQYYVSLVKLMKYFVTIIKFFYFVRHTCECFIIFFPKPKITTLTCIRLIGLIVVSRKKWYLLSRNDTSQSYSYLKFISENIIYFKKL
jgi:hypothetical protein